MDPPVCRTCGQKHWSRVCNDVTLPEPRNVTPPRNVTAPTTGSTALAIENAALRAEVAHLKRQLAERPPLCVEAAARSDVPQTVGATGSARRPMTSAERVAKHRLKRNLKS